MFSLSCFVACGWRKNDAPGKAARFPGDFCTINSQVFHWNHAEILPLVGNFLAEKGVKAAHPEDREEGPLPSLVEVASPTIL